MLILLAVFFQSVFAASNMTLEVKQRIGALSAATSTSSSDSLSEDEAIEKALNEILPEAFAIVKSTARRFAQNETITVHTEGIAYLRAECETASGRYALTSAAKCSE